MTQLFQRAANDWLSLRQDADHQARAAASPLISMLNEYLNPTSEVEVFDLGAGSGANLAWLAPQIFLPQRWTLIDRDADLLSAAQFVETPDRVLSVSAQQRSIDELTAEELQSAGLITASAVLDILSVTQLDRLAALIHEARVPALLSLNVTGVVELSPALFIDEEITAAFNQHQRRSGLAGPEAAHYLCEQLHLTGAKVKTIETPWLLGAGSNLHRPQDLALLERYLTERVAAATEQRPHLTDIADAWLSARIAQVRQYSLTVRVDHLDILALPTS